MLKGIFWRAHLVVSFYYLVWGFEHTTFIPIPSNCRGSWEIVPINIGTRPIENFARCWAKFPECMGVLKNTSTEVPQGIVLTSDISCIPYDTSGNLKDIFVIENALENPRQELFMLIMEKGTMHPLSTSTMTLSHFPKFSIHYVRVIEYNRGILACETYCQYFRYGSLDWEPFPEPQFDHKIGDLIKWNGIPYIMGGKSNAFEHFDEGTQSWQLGPNMTDTLQHFAPVVINATTLMIIGGRNPSGQLQDSVDIYRTGDTSWTVMDVKYPVRGWQMVAANFAFPNGTTGVLVVGGLISESNYNQSHFLNLETMVWTNLHLPTDGERGTLVQYDERTFFSPFRIQTKLATKVFVADMSASNVSWVEEQDLGLSGTTSARYPIYVKLFKLKAL